MNVINVDSFLTYTIAIIVFFVGIYLTKKITFLRNFNIPEPVTGGLIAAILITLTYFIFEREITFDLSTRDKLLVYFFTCIGLNARVADLVRGGKPLIILLILTLAFIIIQNIVGVAGAFSLNLPGEIGLLAGSPSLIGGHGTAIAWSPVIAQRGVESALEIGIASATLGLVIASLIGGPIAKYLIKKYKLSSESAPLSVGIKYAKFDSETFSHLNFMSVILIIHLCVIVGYIINEHLISLGIKLPLFVSCLLVGMLLSNTVPYLLPKLKWPARTKSLAIVSDFSLSLFLTMSLMSMQLWVIAGLAGDLLIILAFQTLTAIIFILFLVFPLMGKNYESAVLSAGFGGFVLGATPTAIANMTAVTKSHGPAPVAFIILPLVAAFFVDISNSFIIKLALNYL
ncbi:sodium/glutamate symporter [Pseudoalteromonas fuliginea]|uniref:Sodium/glutamate symporter n=1 Tax=Pseudoalteromonas fuliginea TaxID=1872678 RepID=A0ABD3Y6F0_9GAMM|nr:sodium/glutamate symporter [Pseudoalteromonas fuliginea]KDC50015.1 glutamate permease [Pseudoalteromonas fuliginea]KJZ29449.1 glutamate permease [Pseudoalteromonas fuliginea]